MAVSMGSIIKILAGLFGYFAFVLMVDIAYCGLTKDYSMSLKDMVLETLIVMVLLPLVLLFFGGILYFVIN